MLIIQFVVMRQSSARPPMLSIVPVVDVAFRIEVNVPVGVIVIIIIGPVAGSDPTLYRTTAEEHR